MSEDINSDMTSDRAFSIVKLIGRRREAHLYVCSRCADPDFPVDPNGDCVPGWCDEYDEIDQVAGKWMGKSMTLLKLEPRKRDSFALMGTEEG